jgi:hypothetical protein
MLLFREEEHVDRWCRTRSMPRGATLTPEQGWQLAHGWFKDKLKPAWRRPTVEETEALFRGVGLIGTFWTLRE